MTQTELTEQYIEAMKRALADAGVPVYYDEATLPDYVDLFLTPLESVLDERNATVLGWREETKGWRVTDFTDGEIADGFALDLPLFADPADVAREVAAWLAADEVHDCRPVDLAEVRMSDCPAGCKVMICGICRREQTVHSVTYGCRMVNLPDGCPVHFEPQPEDCAPCRESAPATA